MTRNRAFSPPWSWWVRSGERLSLGLDVRRVLDADGMGVSKGIATGLLESRKRIDEGYGLVEAMRREGLKVPDEAWCLLESGEQTGRLGEAMGQVGAFIRESEYRRRDFIGQIWYPVVVLVTGFLVMGVILLWVVPQMRDISRSMGQSEEMPWLTEHIGTLYGALFGVSTALGCLASAGWILTGYLGRSSVKWAALRESVIGHMPYLGFLRKTRREARILRQLGTLLQGGITLPAALQMAASRSQDRFEYAQLLEFRKGLLMGISFEDSLRVFCLVQKCNQPLLITGQESGQLDTYLLRVATDLDQEVSWKLKQALRILEPVTIFCLATLIAGLVLAYLLPTIRMMEQLA